MDNVEDALDVCEMWEGTALISTTLAIIFVDFVAYKCCPAKVEAVRRRGRKLVTAIAALSGLLSALLFAGDIYTDVSLTLSVADEYDQIAAYATYEVDPATGALTLLRREPTPWHCSAADEDSSCNVVLWGHDVGRNCTGYYNETGGSSSSSVEQCAEACSTSSKLITFSSSNNDGVCRCVSGDSVCSQRDISVWWGRFLALFVIIPYVVTWFGPSSRVCRTLFSKIKRCYSHSCVVALQF